MYGMLHARASSYGSVRIRRDVYVFGKVDVVIRTISIFCVREAGIRIHAAIAHSEYIRWLKGFSALITESGYSGPCTTLLVTFSTTKVGDGSTLFSTNFSKQKQVY